MIMDEPTNNLGVPEQRKVMSLIATLREERELGTQVTPQGLLVLDLGPAADRLRSVRADTVAMGVLLGARYT